MKQAQLPFQMVSALGSPNMLSNKKRKFESPSPVECRSPKSGKNTKTQNAAKRVKGSTTDVVKASSTEDENQPADEQSDKTVVIEDGKESGENGAVKQEKKSTKESETSIKKKKDYGTLSMFLKKAQSKKAKDDVQLLPMSDYESSNSNSSLTKTVDSRSVKNVETQISIDLCSADSMDTEIAATNVESPNNDNKENTDVSSETKISDNDFSRPKKDTVTANENDARHVESESDICISSSEDDAGDDLDKSTTENAEKDKPVEVNDGCKTPKNRRSIPGLNRKLTPKEVERRMQSAKKREERERLKMEKEKKREEEREIRRKEKEEKEKEKELKRKEKEEKDKEKEQKRKEKEVKDEERRKREEEKLEVERKKQKAASNFANFFVAKKQDAKAAEEENVVKDQNFMPFEVKVDMRLAPTSRRYLNDEHKLSFDGLFNKGVSKTELYLDELKSNRSSVGRSEKTWPFAAKDEVTIIDEDDGASDAVYPGSAAVAEKHRPKLLLFAENRRPPFWGTWRKKSAEITPRKPFAKDSKWFDYDVDSDDEWEEEEPGESLRGSDDERDEEGPEENNEYDVDNDFMVPHGYLSDEEGKADEEDGEDMSPESQKLKLKILGEQFEAERKTKTSQIKPKVIGCIWQAAANAYPENTNTHVLQILSDRQAWVREIPIILYGPSASEAATPSLADGDTTVSQVPGSKKKRVPEEAIPTLIRLVHGNNNGRIFLIKEFLEWWEKNRGSDRQISKLSLSRKLKEIASWIACPDEGPMHLRSCWYVREEVRKEYNCLDLTLPNRWEYTLRPTRRSDAMEVEKPEKVEKEKEKEKEKRRIPLITQFTKKITQEEMQKQLTSKPATSQGTKTPKRVPLISVPRGEQFKQLSRNNLLSKFVNCSDPKSSVSPTDESTGNEKIPTVNADQETEEVVIIEKEVLEHPDASLETK